MRWRFWILWFLCQLLWLVAVPLLFGVWLHGEVDAQYAAGLRVSTDGDSISLPVGGVAILNFALLAVLNIVWAVWAFCRRRSAP
jgi:hypothetical protein